jgi:hypothetical protein
VLGELIGRHVLAAIVTAVAPVDRAFEMRFQFSRLAALG